MRTYIITTMNHYGQHKLHAEDIEVGNNGNLWLSNGEEIVALFPAGEWLSVIAVED